MCHGRRRTQSSNSSASSNSTTSSSTRSRTVKRGRRYQHVGQNGRSGKESNSKRGNSNGGSDDENSDNESSDDESGDDEAPQLIARCSDSDDESSDDESSDDENYSTVSQPRARKGKRFVYNSPPPKVDHSSTKQVGQKCVRRSPSKKNAPPPPKKVRDLSDSESSGEEDHDSEDEVYFLRDSKYEDPDDDEKEDDTEDFGLPEDPSKVQGRVVRHPDGLTVEDILFFGLLKVGFDERSQRKTRSSLRVARFKAHFGVGPKTVHAIYVDLRKECASSNLKYQLLAMNWLKLYDTEHVAAARWKHCEDTIRAKQKMYARRIQSLKEKKIIFGGFKDSEIHWVTVDTVNFRTFEFRKDPSTKYFNPKSNGPGLKYEFAVALRRPDLVWIRGPIPAGQMHDSTVFRGGRKNDKKHDKTALYWKLPVGKKAIGDSGYAGMPDKVTVTKDGQSKALKQFLGRAKNRQESLHTRLKSFNVLSGCFRHGKGTESKLELHKTCVEAVCVIVQYDMENGSPVFDC